MSKAWAILCFLIALTFVVTAGFEGAVAALFTAIIALPALLAIGRLTDDTRFLSKLFLSALALRLAFGLFIYVSGLLEFFGADAVTYDGHGKQIVDVWFGLANSDDYLSIRAMSTGTPGWGMNYLVALIYLVTGPNPLAAQSFCAVIGAATSPLVYICSMKIFHNRRVGKLAALLVAFLPAFIIWSGQLLKDGLIIFLLVLAMTMVIRLQKNFSYVAVAVLIFSLFGILSLRFYIFYMVAVSVAGSFIIGQSGSAKSMARGLILLVIMGVALTYLGVLRTATDNFEKFGDFERLQASRSDMAKRGDSGFGEDLDVSTAEGAVVALPIGLLFLMLAPFPWQATSLRQAITMPEMFVWWAMIPLIFTGLAYTIRHKLREAIPILIFTLMLTIAYSIFQGNVGTAYRQRTQIQVFLFMFIAVGWTLMQEKRENHRAARLAARQKQEAHLIKRGVEG